MKKPYLNGLGHVRNVLKYLFSHSAVFNDRMHNFSYIGKFSPYWYKKVNESKVVIPVICEKCGSTLKMLDKTVFKPFERDGLLYAEKSYVVEKDYDGPFNDLYVYERPYKVNVDKILMECIYTYDLEYRDNKSKKKPEVKYKYYYGTWVKI